MLIRTLYAKKILLLYFPILAVKINVLLDKNSYQTIEIKLLNIHIIFKLSCFLLIINNITNQLLNDDLK